MLPLAIVCGSCNPRSRVEAARVAVEQFHRHYNAQQFTEMYKQVGPAVHQSTSQEEFTRYQEGLRRKLGEFQSAEIINYNIIYLFRGPQVRLDYHCTYANAVTTESFEVHFRNGGPVIDAYRVDSPLLNPPGKRSNILPRSRETPGGRARVSQWQLDKLAGQVRTKRECRSGTGRPCESYS
jgi:hypothetical protein